MGEPIRGTTGLNCFVLLTPRLVFEASNVRLWWAAFWGLIDNMHERRAAGPKRDSFGAFDDRVVAIDYRG